MSSSSNVQSLSDVDSLLSRLETLAEGSGQRAFEICSIVWNLFKSKLYLKEKCDDKPDTAEKNLSRFTGAINLSVADAINMIDWFSTADKWQDRPVYELCDESRRLQNQKHYESRRTSKKLSSPLDQPASAVITKSVPDLSAEPEPPTAEPTVHRSDKGGAKWSEAAVDVILEGRTAEVARLRKVIAAKDETINELRRENRLLRKRLGLSVGKRKRRKAAV